MLAYRETLRRSHPRTGADYLGAVNGLASLLAKRGQLAEAEDVLNEARELYPRHPKLVRNLAKILRGTNREDEAEQLERTLQEGEDESDGPP